MNKKGISPLIATVLLIGATIALAALVMVWSQNLFKSTTDRTKAGIEAEMICTEVQFRVDSAVGTDTTSTLRIVNNGDHDIVDFVARVYEGDDVELGSVDGETLSSYGSEEYTITYESAAATQIELIPVILLEDSSQKTCGTNVEKVTLTAAA
jgi:flagellin-like protein